MQLDVGDGLAVLEALVDLLFQGCDCLLRLSLDALLDDLGVEGDGQKLDGGALAIQAVAEDGELEAAGQSLADVVLAQVGAGVKGGEDHLLADGSLEIAFDVGGEGEGSGGGDVGHLGWWLLM